MTIASVLVQPQRITRVSADANLRLIDDVTRMIALLVEDAVHEGPVAQALLDAVIAMGPRLQHELESRVRAVAATMRIRAQSLVASLEGFGSDIADADDPANAIALAGRLLTMLSEGLDTLTYPGLRERVQFVADLLEKDLGLSAAFIEAQILALLNDAADRIAALDDGGDAALRRRRRATAATFRRLGRFLQANFHFPGLDVDGVTRTLYRLLQQAGIPEVVRQARCALSEFETAVEGTRALGAALPDIGARSVGAAALVELSGQPVYAWYPSWLLSDEDLLLLGLSDLKNAARLIATIRDSALEVPVFLREKFTPAQLAGFAGVTVGTEPTEEQKLIVLAVLNKVIQGPLIYDSERFPLLAPSLPDDLKEEQLHAIENNDVLLANRHFLCHVFQDDLEDASGSGARWFAWLGRTLVEIVFGEPPWPRNQVSVSADRRFIMCDDMPLLTGENLNWYDAPIFSAREYGQTFWIFDHFRPQVCEGFAHHLAWPATLGKAVWHLVQIILDQPGHRVGSSIAVSLEFAESLNQLIFGRPVNGYAIGDWGKWLSSPVVGPRGLAIFGGSWQGTHTSATAGNIALFWLTMYLGDIIRTAGPPSIINKLRNLWLGVMTLVNFGGPRDGPSTLPDHPAQNHLKQGPVDSLVSALYGIWLLSYYKPEDHSIEIWSPGDALADRRTRAFTLWLGGGIAMGVFAGVTTTLVAQILAWAEDWARFGKTVGLSALISVLQFWFLEYLLVEGRTDDGTYNPQGPGPFKGYPDKDTSPYKLPFPGGVALYCGQGNNGMWSHNDIINSGGTQQCYAYDFGHDHQQPVCAARGGIVVAFNDNFADNTSGSANVNRLIIMHTTNDAEHDDPFGTGPVTTYARYLHGAQNGVTAAFASRGLGPPVPGVTVVNQGDVIMLADDTGKSFHSHLHIDVVTDSSGNVVAPAAASPGTLGIPFVFRDVRGDGRCINLTWYESENG
jgi:hypothetical protein